MGNISAQGDFTMAQLTSSLANLGAQIYPDNGNWPDYVYDDPDTKAYNIPKLGIQVYCHPSRGIVQYMRREYYVFDLMIISGAFITNKSSLDRFF